MVPGMLNHWYILCRSKELKNKSPLARTVCNEAVVGFRDREGNACVLQDRCAHRNMALSRGSVTEHGIRCSYHGWAYAGDGHCSNIPASCDGCEVYSKIKIRSYQVCEKQGLVWMWLGCEDPAENPLEFPEFDSDGWHHWFMQRDFEGDAFHCVENFLDVPHTAHVHKGLFRGEEESITEIEVTAGKDWIQAEFLNEGEMNSWIGRMLVPKGSEITHTDRFQLPYVTRVDYRMSESRQYIVMSQCTPVDDENTRVFTYMAYRFSPFGKLVRLGFEPLSHIILNQDVKVIREQTEDIRRTGDAKFLYYETDAIAKGIRQLLDGKSLEGYKPQRKKLRV